MRAYYNIMVLYIHNPNHTQQKNGNCECKDFKIHCEFVGKGQLFYDNTDHNYGTSIATKCIADNVCIMINSFFNIYC